MEISIDLKLMRDIVFKDETMLKEMLDEWKSDSKLKIEEIKIRYLEKDTKRLFNKIHEIKTNFSMVHCGEAIRFSERLIRKIEDGTSIQEIEVLELEKIVAKINNLIVL